MKSVIRKMNTEYDEICKNFNKSKSFCHSMNIEDYKIIYKDFFDNKDNVLFEQNLAKDALIDNENVFVDWLKRSEMVKRGEIYYADLSPVVGSEQGGIRPVLIVQNDIGNKYSPTVIAAAITSQLSKAKLPTHIEIGSQSGLAKDSVVLLEQIRTLDKKRLKEKICDLPEIKMAEINQALLISLGFYQ